jgi:hypothetical protein
MQCITGLSQQSLPPSELTSDESDHQLVENETSLMAETSPLDKEINRYHMLDRDNKAEQARKMVSQEVEPRMKMSQQSYHFMTKSSHAWDSNPEEMF